MDKVDIVKARKDIVSEFFRYASQGNPKEGLRFFAPKCKQHNPYVTGDVGTLMDARASMYKSNKIFDEYLNDYAGLPSRQK